MTFLIEILFTNVTSTLGVANISIENCRILLARLEYLRDTFQIKEGDFLTFDALVHFYCS